MLALLLTVLGQGHGLEVTSSVDRSRVGVGEEFVFTLRAIGHNTAPFRVELPPFDGLALLERSERTDVVVGTGQTTRAFTMELRLRAEQVGSWTIGPIRVEQGDASAFSAAESVSVSSGSSSGGSSRLDPDLLAMIPSVPPPRVGGPAVHVLASADRVFMGDQLNVMTAAWLPRGLRIRLRQPPTLTPPSLAGVWSTPRPAVTGAVASRELDSESYDLYVSFQTAYPLNPGPLTIPPARLAWVQPATRSSNGEERHSVSSAPVTLTVQPLPAAGRPAGFAGPVARELRVDYELGASSARAGAVLPVKVGLSGAGNIPLWPEPAIAWPATVRVYQEGSESFPSLSGTRLGGRKNFRFGIVPDSAGSLSLPALDYAYFDPVTAGYRVAHAPAIVVPVLEATPVTEQRDPLPIETPDSDTFVERVMGLPPLALGALVALPLLLLAGLVLWDRRAPRRTAPAPIAGAAERLGHLLNSLVPPGTPSAPRALTRALREAGVERRQAERLVRLHLVLEEDRFGTKGSRDAGEALGGEIESLLAALPKRIRRAGGIAALWAGVLLAAAAFPGRAAAQSGLELYARGDYASAARAFRAEAAIAPARAARWYDLAAAEYLAHQDADAVAALLLARARAPRDRYVKALWSALAREHEQLRRAQRNWPLSAEECFALALAALWLGAALFALLPRRRTIGGALLAIAMAGAIAGLALRAQRQGPVAVLAGGASLRLSPHGLAPERGTVPAFSVVRLERQLGGWWLVRTSNGAAGWVPAEVLARSPALN